MSQQRACILIPKFIHPVCLKLIFNFFKSKCSFSFDSLVAGKQVKQLERITTGKAFLCDFERQSRSIEMFVFNL